MQQFHFPLERALRYKEQREKLAEWRWRQALSAQHACEAQIAQLRQRIQAVAAGLQGKVGQVWNVPTWLATYQQSEQLGREVLAAEAQLVQFARQVVEATAQRRVSAQQAEVLRQLRRRRLEAHQKETARQEQIFLEEITLQRWGQAAGAEDEFS